MNSLSHRHLVLAYAVTWLIHLAYLGYVLVKWRAAKAQSKDY